MKEHPEENSALSDVELIALYKESYDLKWLGILYQPYTAMVYGVCLKYLKNKEDSKDAVMQIFEKLIDSLKKHDVQNFKSWLHVTARNFCLMELRKRKQHQTNAYFDDSSTENMEFSISMHPNDEDILEKDLNKLKNCIEKLPLKQKTCIELFFMEEKSYKEVCVHSGYELKKVKSYIQNGRRNLKTCIENA